MDRKGFLKGLVVGTAGIIGAGTTTGCMSKIGNTALNKENGEPFRCDYCGYLMRSKSDITGHRCPRCYRKKLGKISEEEMAEFLILEQEE